MDSQAHQPQKRETVLIIVENLPVPLDRRVWQESCALRDAGYQVVVICPKMRGYVKAEEVLDGIQIYRHWISDEAGGLLGFIGEYASALLGELRLTCKAWWRHRFKLIHLCNPPDLLFLVAWPFRLLFGVKVIYDVHDAWPEMFEAKFQRRGLLYWAVRMAERLTYACADTVLATNQSVRGIALDRGGKGADEVFIVRTAPKIAVHQATPDPSLRKGKAFLVGYVGVMGDADGLQYLLEAADHLIRVMGRTDIHFLLMGTGPEHAKLVTLRDRLGLQQHVDLPGRVTNEFLFSALRTIDLGVSCDPINPYNDHCTMNKVLEYMAFGKAQVLFDLKEGRFSAGEAAVYVSENSPIRLAEAIAGVLDDGASRDRMAAAGLERFRTELNWEKSVEQLLIAYHRTLATSL
jgi:glycosyltransferase involved in cell wall biosynthesis